MKSNDIGDEVNGFIPVARHLLNCLAWWAWSHDEISRGRCIELSNMPPEILRGWMIDQGYLEVQE